MKHLTAAHLRALLWCLVLALPLLGVSCEKPTPEPNAVPLPTELKSYTLFQPGTYWTCKDSVSQQLDSVFVVSTKMSVVRIGMSYSDQVAFKYEDFRLRTHSSENSIDQVYSVSRKCGLPFEGDVTKDAYPCWAIMRSQYLPNSTADEGNTPVFPYRIPRDQARTDYLNGTQPYWHSAPLTIGEDTYPDVLEVKIPQDASEGGWPTHYYWAPGKGIVRQRVKVSGIARTRTLVRSRIVQ